MKKQFKKTLSLVLALLLLFALAGCGSKTNEPSANTSGNSGNNVSDTQNPSADGPGTDNPGTGAAKTSGNASPPMDTLRIASATEPVTMDLQSVSLGGNRNCAMAIFDTLVYMSEDGRGLKPGVAESWDWVDEVTLKLNLRKDVTSSVGSKFTANDALFVLRRGAGTPGLSNKYSYLDAVNSYAEDDYTLIIKLPKPFSNFPYLLTQGCFIMYCEADFNRVGAEAFAHDPIGIGAYVLDEWVTGSHFNVTKRSDYWGVPGTFEHISWNFISDANSRALALQSGDVDLAEGLTVSIANTINSINGLEAWERTALRSIMMFINCENPIFSNKLVRQALSIGIDKQALANVMTGGAKKASSGLFHHESPYWNGKEYVYDLSAALDLLSDAGYADGFSFKLTATNDQSYIDLAEALQGELKKLNITTEIEILDGGTFFPTITAGDFDIYLMHGSGFVPDDVLSFFDSANLNGGSNNCRYNNPEYDKLYYASQAELDDAKRASLYKQIDDLLMVDCPIVMLYEQEGFFGSIKGLRITENDSIGAVSYTRIAYNP